VLLGLQYNPRVQVLFDGGAMQRMIRFFSRNVVGFLVLVLAPVSSAVLGQPAQGPAASASPTPDYHPSMGDLMTMAIQPRHTKLGLAGSQKNWAYAAYELSELRNAFARIARTIPSYRNSDMTVLIDGITREPLVAVEQAIHEANPAHFNIAYERLTAACNGCHRSQDHAMVVIKVPRGDVYPDQEFGR
jgi:hypothetical protein